MDLDRLRRQGFPEVVFARGKTPTQTAEALRRLNEANGHALATCVLPEVAEAIQSELPLGCYDACSKLYRIGEMPRREGRPVVVSAGTSDQPVAEEAALVAEALGKDKD